MLNNKLIFVILIIIFSACSGVKYPYCINKSTQDVVISWGEYSNPESKLIKGFGLKANGYVYDLATMKDSLGVKHKKIDDTTFCKAYRKLKAAILKTQKLNVTADTVRFIRYSNLKTGYSIYGFWNNKLKAIGSKEFREVFSILNSVSPSKFEE